MSATFTPMIEFFPEPLRQGEARISPFEITRDEAGRESMRGLYTVPGRFVRLHVGGVLMMSDTMHEHRSNLEVVWNAHGDVLIMGLGMGMVLVPLLGKADVRTVTVIERSQDVIDLVQPRMPHPEKLTVICADALAWKPPKGQTWDTIYFDIWPDISTDNLKDMHLLHRRFCRKVRKPKGWMGSWCRERLENTRRREKREEDRWAPLKLMSKSSVDLSHRVLEGMGKPFPEGPAIPATVAVGEPKAAW